MSRIGNKPINVPSGVTVNATDSHASVKGPNGELSMALVGGVSLRMDGSQVIVQRPDDSKQSRSYHGLVRNILNNMIEGVAKGFAKQLEIEGVGFRAAIQGQKLTMALGYSKPVEFTVPDGVKVVEEGGTKLTVSGADKQKVGETAARIRAFAPAEPYKGKGLRYKDERVRRKVGKTVA